MSDMTREEYEKLALDRLAELARSENERIALEAARTMLVHLRLTSPQRRESTDYTDYTDKCPGQESVKERSVTSVHHVGLNPPAVDCEDVERAREHVLRAMDRCAGLLDDENPYVVLRAAREILQHWRHLCRERFRWTAWSEVVERRDKKRRGVAARARVRDLGRELAGVRRELDGERGDMYRKPAEGGIGTCPPTEEGNLEPWEQEFEGEEEGYRFGPPPPMDWGDDPEERAPP